MIVAAYLRVKIEVLGAGTTYMLKFQTAASYLSSELYIIVSVILITSVYRMF